MLHLLLPLVSARGQAADGSMGPDLSTHGSRRKALDYRPEVGGVAMSRPSTLPPPLDRVQSLFEPTHGKPTKIALQYKPLLVSCVRAARARLNTHMTQH